MVREQGQLPPGVGLLAKLSDLTVQEMLKESQAAAWTHTV
jgi:hypothetical protein